MKKANTHQREARAAIVVRDLEMEAITTVELLVLLLPLLKMIN